MTMDAAGRERVTAALRHEEPDHLPILDTPWESTIARWHGEGLPREIGSIAALEGYFGFDLARRGYHPTPGFAVEVIEKTDTYVIETTPEGGKVKNLLDYSSTPHMLDWPVANHGDWDRIARRLHLDGEDFEKRLPALRENHAEARDAGRFVAFHGGGINYDKLQFYVNPEELLMLLVTDPTWIKEMASALARAVIEGFEACVGAGLGYDGAWVCGDMGYRNGLLFSPGVYRGVFQESDRMLTDFFHARGLPVVLHSCGNVSELLPDIIDSGFDCLMPLEVKAGMDLVKLKRQFGERIALMGGIDVRTMTDPSAFARELDAKLPTAKEGGGYIYHSDHSVPKDVSFESFCKGIELVKERW